MFDNTIGLFAIYDKDEIVAFLHCEQGHPIEKEKAFVLMAACRPNVPLKVKRSLLKTAEQWMKSKGAEKWEMATTRRQMRAFGRLYGLEPSPDYTMEKTI